MGQDSVADKSPPSTPKKAAGSFLSSLGCD
jgi:hypothetical protein